MIRTLPISLISIPSARFILQHSTTQPTLCVPLYCPITTATSHLRPFYQKTTHNMASATSFYDFKPLDKKSQPYDLHPLKNKVTLIVNTASKCGFTPQLTSLETLYKSIQSTHPDEFTILAFPCNQFMAQDPASNDDIQSFCQANYGVTFPVLAKTEVNGANAEPLFEWLKEAAPGLMGLRRVKWNFEKWLVGRDGKVVGRWASTTKPEALEEPILKALGEEGKSVGAGVGEGEVKSEL